MRLLFVHSELPVGGAESLRKVIAGEMNARRIDFCLCLINGGGSLSEDLRNSGIQIDELLRNNSIYNPFAFLALAKYFRRHRPKIVQSSQFNTNFHTRIAAKLAGVPVVICEEHGLYYWKRWWHRLADRVLSHWCDKIIAVSNAVKSFNVVEIGISHEKIEVLHNCLNTNLSKYTRSREEVRAALGISLDTFVVGHVGTLRKEKGHDTLLKAFVRFRERRAAKLLLVGSGPIKNQLENQIKSLGLLDDVIFVGTRSDVPDIHKAMDLFVFPSCNEALGIALLEAMYSGLPVIATKVGGIPEIVKDRETGLLVDSQDVNGLSLAMLRLAEDPALRRSLGKTAHQYVLEHHSPQTYVDSLLSIHDELLKQKGLS